MGGITHKQFQEEPHELVDWFIAFANTEAEVENEQIRAASRDGKSQRR